MRNLLPIVLIAGLILPAACKPPPPQAADRASATPPAAKAAVPTTPPHTVDFRIGDFTYHADGGNGQITIKARAGGGYDAELSVGAAGCSGQATGTGSATTNGVDFVSMAADDFPACHAAITFKDGKVRVEELENCSDYHGRACAFSSYP